MNNLIFNVLIFTFFLNCVRPENLFSQNFPCTTTKMCSNYFDNAECVHNKCACKNHENCTFKRNMMKIVNKIGEVCNALDQCVIKNSYCTNDKKCECMKDFIESTAQKECLPFANGLHSQCIEDVQCKKLNGICSNNTCACRPGYFYFDNICVKSLSIGDICTMNEDCAHIMNSSCIGAKCSCLIGYVASNRNKCLLKAEFVSSPCEDDIQCVTTLGTGSKCSNKTCQCKDVFHYKQTTNECVNDFFLGENCGTHEDCHQPGPGSSRLECLLGQCSCKYPYYEENNYCISGSIIPQPFNYLLYIIVFTMYILVN